MKRGSTPRRRPKKGGYARGDETRAQIIAAALRVFGEQGYDQASTRHIAAEAGVNPPALQYYFDGKEGLHRACAQFIIDRASVTLTRAVEQAQLAVASGRIVGAATALERLLDALTDSLAEPGSETWSRFIHRGKGDGAGPGVEMIRERLSAPVVDAVSGLLAVLTGGSRPDEEIRLRTLLLLSQVHAVHSSRENVLRSMRWRTLDADKIALIKRLIREHTRFAVAAAVGDMKRGRGRPRGSTSTCDAGHPSTNRSPAGRLPPRRHQDFGS